MTTDEYEKLLDLNEDLCRQYNETEDLLILEKIAATEYLLFTDQDHRKDLQEEKDWLYQTNRD